MFLRMEQQCCEGRLTKKSWNYFGRRLKNLRGGAVKVDKI